MEVFGDQSCPGLVECGSSHMDIALSVLGYEITPDSFNCANGKHPLEHASRNAAPLSLSGGGSGMCYAVR